MSNVIKPMSPEEEFFARENAEKLRKIAADEKARMAKEEQEALKKLHHMHCPKCGFTLQSIVFRTQTIEKCLNCGGSFLDAGELEALVKAEDKHGVVGALLDIFATKKK